MTSKRRFGARRLLFFAVTVCVAHRVLAGPIDLPGSLPNLFGVGLGTTTEYAGGNERIVGGLPGLRYTTASGHLLEWYGPYAQFDAGSGTGFEWGPAASLRLGRHDVDDPVVSKIHTIPTTVEGGGFIGYEYIHRGTVPYRLRGELTVTTNAGAVFTGSRLSLNGSAWLPLSPRIFTGVGLGASWASGGFNNTYFGVTSEDSMRSGLPYYSPASGVEQITSWLACVYQIDRSWYAGALVFYQRLTGPAGDSPIVVQRGTRNQLTFGAGAAYAFR
ncbi:MltA-interacting MipA [Caballeronia novacaledonica]|uniref:MltA-interacting MipA n=1 Tax=Caballeronia novacaledonica TaxID=1544861 RepID=A0A2U3I247_9BURK|nr:MipA/OmpV family protein [Caballeronia novacaledonica]SPB14173.1 MltA-interacting MipA [Caballeronia novacaledonica]